MCCWSCSLRVCSRVSPRATPPPNPARDVTWTPQPARTKRKHSVVHTQHSPTETEEQRIAAKGEAIAHLADVDVLKRVEALAGLLDLGADRVGDELAHELLEVDGGRLLGHDVRHLLADCLDLQDSKKRTTVRCLVETRRKLQTDRKKKEKKEQEEARRRKQEKEEKSADLSCLGIGGLLELVLPLLGESNAEHTLRHAKNQHAVRLGISDNICASRKPPLSKCEEKEPPRQVKNEKRRAETDQLVAVGGGHVNRALDGGLHRTSKITSASRKSWH